MPYSRDRAITIYLSSKAEKMQFVRECKNLGLSVSFVASLCFYRGIEARTIEELAQAIAQDRTSVQKGANVVASEKSPRRPTAKSHKPR